VIARVSDASSVTLRAMRMDDLDAVLRIQREAYGDDYQESAQVLGRKLRLAPDACWFAERDGVGLGYVFAHPWSADAPRLHAPIVTLPPVADHGFLHDLAVSPRARGERLGGRLFAQVLDWSRAAGHRGLQLVALADAVGFWRRLGFVPCAQALPEGYGKGAVLMRLG
jgi:GNAT superfamily N-acetyltransferase